MKGVKGKLLKKLKTVKAIGYLKPDIILQANALGGYLHASPPKSSSVSRAPLVTIQEEPKKVPNENILPVQEPEIIDVSELMKDLEDQEMEFDEEVNDKENVRPKIEETKEEKDEVLEEKEFGNVPLSEVDVSSFRRPDLNSRTLFDPNLLAAFEQAVMEIKALEAERRSRIEEIHLGDDVEEPPLKARKTGGKGIRKTFEDCQKIRSLLENLRILFFERDISMHSEFKEEMWRILGGKMVPPRLFIKGRYIGGAEEVLGLHEQGKFKPLIEGIPIDRNEGPCEGCAGFRFIVCFNCNGSRKIVPEGGESMNCSECNENGVIICPFCC
ncbi:Glutaredoxin-related protein [Handroanthus impetiginosus]|uniref:Glutaredoxin-related protein n=1 Tax=Handroanthus impetiginosus TaxID=429701 RepID=A0A2G9HLZ0_9LAMI|nr:Glutaredoxin-related protein [Handroanthus impetiginosus]